MDAAVCPFCTTEESVLESEYALARWDANPVTPGHLLVKTRRHVADFFETSDAERQALLDLLQQARDLLQRERRPDGLNVGVNIGEAAGQTVAHVHILPTPRYRGDMPQPRGGVRGVIPDKQSY